MLNIFIKGYPTVKRKVRGDIAKIAKWKKVIIEQTKEYEGLIKGPCKMKVVYLFDQEQFPSNFPLGPDMDNHLKSFQDALNKTIFKNAPGQDSCIVNLHATKYIAKDKTGVHLKIWNEDNRFVYKNLDK